ncbi:MAG TPA: PEP-CTERM sorting domain-containing protein [Chthoniobacterales bacterium]
MKKTFLSILTGLALGTGVSHAVTTGLQSDLVSGGSTSYALWDVFPGPYRVGPGAPAGGTAISAWPYTFTYSSSAAPATLTATATASAPFANYITGPTDADGGTIPGNRDLFYTFFAAVDWKIQSISTTDVTEMALQISYDTASTLDFSSITLTGNSGGVPAPVFTRGDEFTTAGGYNRAVAAWVWTGLDIHAGENFSLAFSNPTSSHFGLDAIRLDTNAEMVPEPSSWLLLGLGAGFILWQRRKRHPSTQLR